MNDDSEGYGADERPSKSQRKRDMTALQALGADPVNMPMGEVYSSLAKGIIDGVFAPPDTFRSLHFSELTPYFTGLYTPRGAYPARAMNAERWASLRPLDQSVLEDSIAVWEAALSRQTSRAVQMGLQTAKVTWEAPSRSNQ